MSDPAAQDGSKLRRLLWLALVAAIAVGSLALSFRGIDGGQLLDVLASTDVLLLAAATLVITASYGLRAIRWRILLGPGGAVTRMQAFWATNLGYLGNNVLPARAGELLRAAALARATGIRPGFVLATALVERLYDTVGLLLIATVAIAASSHPPQALTAALGPMLAISCVAFAVLLIGPRSLQRVLERSRSRRAAAIASRTATPVADFSEGSRSLRGPRAVAMFSVATAGAWSMDALAALLVVRACGASVSFVDAVVFVAALAFASAIPSTPGYLGVYQLVAVSVLPPFGVDRDSALAAVILLQAATLVVSGVFGVVGARRLAVQSVDRGRPDLAPRAASR